MGRQNKANPPSATNVHEAPMVKVTSNANILRLEEDVYQEIFPPHYYVQS